MEHICLCKELTLSPDTLVVSLEYWKAVIDLMPRWVKEVEVGSLAIPLSLQVTDCVLSILSNLLSCYSELPLAQEIVRCLLVKDTTVISLAPVEEGKGIKILAYFSNENPHKF